MTERNEFSAEDNNEIAVAIRDLRASFDRNNIRRNKSTNGICVI